MRLIFHDALGLWERLLFIAMFGGGFEYGQIEYTKDYPVYSAVGDLAFIMLGASVIELIAGVLL